MRVERGENKSMRHHYRISLARTTLIVAAAGALAARPVKAQTPDPVKAQTPDTTEKIDQDAMDALNKMGAYLRSLKAFQVTAEVTTEEVLPDGQKIQFGSLAELIAEKPNHLRVDVNSDREHRVFFFDGKTFTLYAPRPMFYATLNAPPTIAEMANQLEDKYGINLPFVDLFRWGTPESGAEDITAATDFGASQVDGVTCEHYAFRQAGLDWQVWIQQGDYPLPRKLVLTTLTDEARPQHESRYTWNLAPSMNAATFAFVPTKDAKKIALAELRMPKTAAKK
jgi:hypothetical protein